MLINQNTLKEHRKNNWIFLSLWQYYYIIMEFINWIEGLEQVFIDREDPVENKYT